MWWKTFPEQLQGDDCAVHSPVQGKSPFSVRKNRPKRGIPFAELPAMQMRNPSAKEKPS
jgi:hypothetical protein